MCSHDQNGGTGASLVAGDHLPSEEIVEMAEIGPISSTPEVSFENAKIGMSEGIWEEEDSGLASSIGYNEYEEEGYPQEDADKSKLGYGFEEPPRLDPFHDGEDIFKRPAIDCPYEEESEEEEEPEPPLPEADYEPEPEVDPEVEPESEPESEPEPEPPLPEADYETVVDEQATPMVDGMDTAAAEVVAIESNSDISGAVVEFSKVEDEAEPSVAKSGVESTVATKANTAVAEDVSPPEAVTIAQDIVDSKESAIEVATADSSSTESPHSMLSSNKVDNAILEEPTPVTSIERTKEDIKLAAEASEMLQEAMGIEVKVSKKGRKKKLKSRSASPAVDDDLVVTKKDKTKRKSSGTSMTSVDGPNSEAIVDTSFAPAALPVEPSASDINEIDETTDAGSRATADMRSPNDVLPFHKGNIDIQSPLGSGGRVQYTCMTVGGTHMAFGTNSGMIYVFEIATSRLLEVIERRDGAITTVALGKDEDLLAAGCEGGSVALWRGSWGVSETSSQLLKIMVEHGDNAISALKFSYDSKMLFSGDNAGNVFATTVRKKPIIPSTSRFVPNMKIVHKAMSTVLPDAEVVYRCKAKILQLDTSQGGTLLISSEKGTSLANPEVRKLWQIGSKPRDGDFGACFGPGHKFPAVYAARPGARLWVARAKDGLVLSTINLKEQLLQGPSSIISSRSQADPLHKRTPALNFKRIYIVRESYLVSWNENELIIIDPAKGRLLGWYNNISGIIDVAVSGDEIFLLKSNLAATTAVESLATAPQLTFECERIVLLPPGECATSMASNGDVADAIEMLLEYYDSATPSKFFENVEQSDLNILTRMSVELTKAAQTPIKSSPGKLAETSPAKIKHCEELERRISEVSLKAEEIRKAAENQAAVHAEAAFQERLDNRKGELSMSELIVEASMDGDLSPDIQSEDEGVTFFPKRNVSNGIFAGLASAIKFGSLGRSQPVEDPFGQVMMD